MADHLSEGHQHLHELMRSDVPLFSQGGDPENPDDPLNHQPMNIPAVVANHLRSTGDLDLDRMRSFTMRISEDHHLRLVLLAEALGTSKTTLARELLEIATREAVGSLPEELQADVRRKFLEAL